MITRARPLIGLLLVVVFLWPGIPARAALSLTLETAGLSADEIDASRQLLDDAVAHLPPSMVAQSDRGIAVRWSDSLPDAVAGRAQRKVLLLNRRYLPALAGALADATPETGAGDPRDAPDGELLATVLHELAHFHDRRHRLSSDPRFLDLAGWQVRARQPWARRSGNRFVDRTPDAYELTSPREFVAVNLQYFLLDPEYACRRPALHRYLSDHFGWSPAHPACADGFVYLDTAAEPGSGEGEGMDDGTASALATLDPERVLAVEYLLAEGNHEPMSRWGHSMLRLVVCAPGRPRGPDCRRDLQHHRVLSFRAFVDDVQLSSWRGLSGSYPSRLFVLPLEQVVDEYTRDQLRALQSIPLQLDRAEIGQLLERVAQLHWSYDGRYYFITNNCAVETFKLLHDGVPRLQRARLAAITPNGLLAKLAHRGVADTAVLDDPAEARRLGYRFDSLRERYQAMFEVARQELALPQDGVEAWLTLSAGQRRAHFEAAGMRAGAALLLLEEAARRRQILLAREDLKRRYLNGRAGNDGADLQGVEATLREILHGSGVASRPAALLAEDGGYGLPQPAELAQLERLAGQHRQRLDQLDGELAVQVQALLAPAVRDELQAIDANLAALGAQLRELNRDAGGIELN